MSTLIEVLSCERGRVGQIVSGRRNRGGIRPHRALEINVGDLAGLFLRSPVRDIAQAGWIGKSGRKDRELKKVLLDEDWVLVTWNCKDFRGQKDAPGTKGVLADVPLHTGLICINGATGMGLDLQRLFFGFVLEELDQHLDLTNQVLEITIDELRESVDVIRYELPIDK
ncbi:MAG: hypothetical protein ABSD67_05810 [Terracidiphilus sp.]|jgi:hypothetical protein